MAVPLRARGAKSQANLKKGGSHSGGRSKQQRLEADRARKIARKLLADPSYRKNLIKRLREGTIQPGVEAMLWYYAEGKPRESMEVEQKSDVKIVHQYTGVKE